jgi:trehalose 6-phosphate phosphatase
MRPVSGPCRRRRRRASASLEPRARELPEPLARLVVRAEPFLVRVLRIARDLVRDGPDLVRQPLAVRGVREQRVDPLARAVVLRQVVLEEELPQNDADADVRERAEREDTVRRRDLRVDVGVLTLDTRDDRADRLGDPRAVDALARLRAEPQRSAIFLDIDGALAPIVPRPEDSFVLEETRAVVRSLVQRYALVAAITGRASDNARELVGVPGVVVVGLHGLELVPVDAEWHERMLSLARGVPFRLEDKGVSVSFHYRGAADEERAREQLEIVATRARALGLKARFGRKVLELLPPVEVHKGTAVRALLERAGLARALYAGDDTTDLDGFAALDGLEVGVRIAVDSPEAPPELLARADAVVDGPAGLLELLRTL